MNKTLATESVPAEKRPLLAQFGRCLSARLNVALIVRLAKESARKHAVARMASPDMHRSRRFIHPVIGMKRHSKVQMANE